MTLSSFPSHMSSTATSSSAPSHTDRQHHGYQIQHFHCKTRRVVTFAWNCNGLTAGKYEELLTALVERNVEIATITETHWKLNRTWSTPAWHIHHSSSAGKGDGMMILVSARRWSSQALGWDVLEAGRLVHVRIRMHTRHIDSIHCYQYADRHDATRKQARQHWWSQLSSLLTRLPARNTLLLQGDFNCSLSRCSGLVGTSHFPLYHHHTIGSQHIDMPSFEQIIRQHQLVALNGWSTTAASYHHGDHGSRIDFVLTRYAHVDSTAKHAYTDWTFPLITDPLHSHAPIITSIACDRKWTSPQSGTFNLPQRLRCRHEWLQQSHLWHSFHTESSLALEDASRAHPSDLVTMIHDSVRPSFASHFAKRSSPVTIDSTPYKEKWKLRWQATHQPNTLRGIVMAWKKWTAFQQACRADKQLAKQRCEHRALQLLEEAQQAADRHDQFNMYRLIQRYSPKQIPQKIQLKSNGQMLTASEAHHHLVDYVKTQWAGPDDAWFESRSLDAFPFTFDELVHSLEHTPACKAVAHGCVPGIAIRTHAHQIATMMFPQLCEWWKGSEIYIPAAWKASWLTWLPKPNKPPVTAANLRGIALQEPLGKQVLAILIHKAQHQALDRLCWFPQFAYVPTRGTTEALLRVSNHCKAVRQLLRISPRKPADRAHQLTPDGCYGGMQVCLDLQRAFDTISRAYLFPNLKKMGIHLDLCTLISAWHTSTAYFVTSAEKSTAVPTFIGVRQGCRGAPFLWSVLVALLLEDLIQDPHNAIPAEWVRAHITFYADDLHVGCVIMKASDVTLFLRFVGILVTKLQSLGLQISSTKSMAIVSLKGIHHQKILRQIMHRTKTGTLLVVPMGASHLKIPVVHSCSYLGIIMSYSNFELATVKHRVSAATQAYHRLHRWLRNKHLRFATRYRIWQSCVVSILVYGLWPIGLNEQGLRLLSKTMYWMIRQLLGNHAYITHDSHLTVFDRHHLQHPCEQLRASAVALQDRHRATIASLPTHDILHCLDWTHLHNSVALLTLTCEDLRNPTVPASVTPPEVPASFKCTHCFVKCDSLANLRRHMSHAHGLQVRRTIRGNPGQFAVDGLPHCAHCNRTFSTWRTFETHLERNCCSWTLQDGFHNLPMQTKPDGIQAKDLEYLRGKSFGSRLLHLIDNKQWHNLQHDRELLDFLLHHCALCGFWFERTQQYMTHVRHRHPRLLPHCLSKSTQLTDQVSGHRPCLHCGGTFHTSHLCVVDTQVALLYVNGAQTAPGCNPQGLASRLQCELCSEVFITTQELQHHLSFEHKLWTHNWVPSRDIERVLGDDLSNPTEDPPNRNPSFVCAHCHRDLQSLPNLRAHITAGYCPTFNPSRIPESKPLPRLWLDAIKDGLLASALKTPNTLTTTCLHCGEGYRRPQDLASHLQQCHGLLLDEAAFWVTMLMELTFPESGCVCTPITVGSTQHVCLPFVQLGMVCARADLRFALPFEITLPKLQMALHLDPKPSHRELCSILVERRFSDLWHLHPFIMEMGTVCLFCHQELYPAQLHWHLMEVHHSDLPWARLVSPMVVEQLQTLFAGSAHCLGCGITYQLPPELHNMETHHDELLSVHLRFQCPISLQLSLILTSPCHGHLQRRHASGHGGDATDLPHIQAHDPFLCADAGRSKRKSRDKTTSTPTMARPRATPKRKCSDVQDRPMPDSPCPPTGTGDSISPEAGLIHRFLKPRSTSHPPPALASDHQLEGIETISDSPPPDAPPTALDEIHADGTPELPSAIQQSCPRGRHLDQGHRKDCAEPGWLLSISPMGPQPGTLSGGLQAECENEHHDQHGGHLGGGMLRGRLGDSFSFIADTTPCTGDSMEAANLHETHGALCGDENLERQSGLAADRSIGPPTQPDSESHCSGAESIDRQGSGQGEDEIEEWEDHQQGPVSKSQYRVGLLILRLRTAQHHCFANSSFLAWLWMHLAREHFRFTDLGAMADVFCDLLKSGDMCATNLRDIVGMEAIMTEWNTAWDQWGQSDTAEFHNFFLSHAALTNPCYQMAWEKREQCPDKMVVRDRSAQKYPVRLQFDLSMTQHSHVSLQSLIHVWQQVDGMISAFTSPAQMLCFHLDRIWEDESSTRSKLQLAVEIDKPVMIPIFVDDTLNHELCSYHVIACTAHYGDPEAGHYQSALRICSDQETIWAVKDDNKLPLFLAQVPDDFLRGLNLMWLLRSDQVDVIHFAELESLMSRDGPIIHPDVTNEDNMPHPFTR
eukprot:Skav204351  [mRNA]  locus=scaffold3936:141329:147985:- [translate_table: standard]